MKLFKRVGAVILLVVAVTVWAGSAWAAPFANVHHSSSIPLRNGKSSNKEATFYGISFWIGYESALTNPPEGGAFGLDSASFTTSSGFVNSGTPFKCQLVLDPSMEYTTALEGVQIVFQGEAQDREKGLPNKNFRWSIGSDSGEARIMDFLTTEQQIEQSIIPDIELSDTAFMGKIVLPSPGEVQIRFHDAAGTRLYQTQWAEITEKTINFADVNINGSDITRVGVRFRPKADTTQRYIWNFYKENSSVANAEYVAQGIRNYGLTAAVSGNTITVTGSVEKDASDVLDLGDITGLEIDWKADLTVTGGRRPSKGIGMINFSNGEFKLTGGTIEIASKSSWVSLIKDNGSATITLDGGAVKSQLAGNNGISTYEGTVIITRGDLNMPSGGAVIAGTLTVNDPSVINGLA